MKKTVFVVGAGASHDFRMPLGSGLIEAIRVRLFKDIAEEKLGERLVDVAVRSGLAGDYEAAAKAIAGGLIAARSIDRFLQSRSEDPLIVWLGKCAIAYCLLQSESQSQLGSGAEGDWVSLHNAMIGASNSWLGRTFSILQEGISPTQSNELLNDISFVTFNYDRCIERYIEIFFRHIMGLSASDSEDIARDADIFHVYGSLGALKDGVDARPFGSHPSECVAAS